MELILERINKAEGYTEGELYDQGANSPVPLCETLEPQWRDLSMERKVPGKTAIPDGRYRVEIRWSNKYRRPMPFLTEVPHFEGIMIHTGNTVADTRGCILVGRRSVAGWLNDSRETFGALMERISRAEEVWVTIKSS